MSCRGVGAGAGESVDAVAGVCGSKGAVAGAGTRSGAGASR